MSTTGKQLPTFQIYKLTTEPNIPEKPNLQQHPSETQQLTSCTLLNCSCATVGCTFHLLRGRECSRLAMTGAKLYLNSLLKNPSEVSQRRLGSQLYNVSKKKISKHEHQLFIVVYKITESISRICCNLGKFYLYV